MITSQTMKRLAVCGNPDAAIILGFRRKIKPHLLAVLKVMMLDCPERVTQVINRRIVITEFTHPKRNPSYKWMKNTPTWKNSVGLYARHEPHFLMARKLVGYGMPGFWWVGRELCKLGRVL